MDKIRAEFEEKFPPNKLLRFDDELDCYVADHQSKLIQALLKDTDIFAQNIAWCGYKAGYQAAKASQWISVEDRIPEQKVEVIAWCGELLKDRYAYYSDGRWIDDENGAVLGYARHNAGYLESIEGVTYWHPRPEAPE